MAKGRTGQFILLLAVLLACGFLARVHHELSIQSINDESSLSAIEQSLQQYGKIIMNNELQKVRPSSLLLQHQQNEEEEELKCRLQFHPMHRTLLGEWLDLDRPMLVSVRSIRQEGQQQRQQRENVDNFEYHLLLFLRHVKNRKKWIYQTTYTCLYSTTTTTPKRSKNSDNNNTTTMRRQARVIPGDPSSPFDFNLMITCPLVVEAKLVTLDVEKERASLSAKNAPQSFTLYNETVIGSLSRCGELSQTSPPAPSQSTLRIGMCTSIRGETARKSLDQWIAYHRLLGVSHFWIYWNEPFDETMKAATTKVASRFLHNRTKRPGANDNDNFVVTYIPFNFYIFDYRPDWQSPFPYFQAAVNNDCIYEARRQKLDWVLTTDVDEYVHVTAPQAAQTEQPLSSFLQQVQARSTKVVGGLIASPIFYGRNSREEQTDHNDSQPKELLIDYTYRRQASLSTFTGLHGRVKLLYRPWLIDYVEVHTAYKRRGSLRQLDVPSELYLQHYKQPENGPFKLRKNHNIQLDNLLQKRFRDKIVHFLDRW